MGLSGFDVLEHALDGRWWAAVFTSCLALSNCSSSTLQMLKERKKRERDMLICAGKQRVMCTTS